MGCLVIGGAGFIGSHLVDRLLADGDAVDVVDDLSTGSLANLASARAVGGELKIHHLDAGSPDLDSLFAMRRPDTVFHLAAVPRRATDPSELGGAIGRTLNVLEAARAHGVSKVVTAVPATAVYGAPAARDLPLKERPLEPRGVRGVVARAVVDLLDVYRSTAALEFTALALASVYGPRQCADGGVVAAFLRAAADGTAPTVSGDGRQTRDFVYVDDVVDAIARAGRRGTGLVVNIGTGTQTAVRDLWRTIAGTAGHEPEIAPARPDELQRFAVSPVRARIHLGWSSWTSLDEGLTLSR
ncbi:MAG: NAD-dependent epimerase/dehydratase family protein [Ilumatobacteraceae bacterium]